MQLAENKMCAPDINDQLEEAVQSLRHNDEKEFTIDSLKSKFPKLSDYSRREIIDALTTLSSRLDIENAAVGGQLWNIN